MFISKCSIPPWRFVQEWFCSLADNITIFDRPARPIINAYDRMYNFSNEEIPVFFPVQEAAQLQPWFTTATLDQGLDLIRNKRVTDFHLIRNTAGALLDGDIVVTLQFEKNTTLYQGFIIRNGSCGLCRLGPHDKCCKHQAALAILGLLACPEQTKVEPISLAFAKSKWLKIGFFLFEWLGRTNYTLQQTAKKNYCRWEIAPTDGLVQVNIPASWVFQAKQFLAGAPARATAKENNNGFSQLVGQLELLSKKSSERQLEDAGSCSIGWSKDTSLWVWLARMLFIFHGGRLPEFGRVQGSSGFLMQQGEAKKPGALTVVLPRSKTMEVVRNVGFSSKEARILPAARECFRVFFNTENSLEVKPCLRLQDGRILDRQELAENRFGGTYYLDGEGFLPAGRLSAEEVFSNPAGQSAALPLLGFLHKAETKDKPFTVAPNDIPAFLEANKKALHCTDNIIDAELLQLQVHELPDRLVIDAFEERDGWCYLSCHYGLGNMSITLRDILQAKAQKLTCLPGKQWLQIEGASLSWLYELGEDRLQTDGSDKIRLSYREMLALTAVIPEVNISIKKKKLRKRLNSLLDTTCWTDDTALTGVPGHLRTYQRNGLAWLNQLFTLGIGGLLADDMGLGKTHQALALLQAAARSGKKRLMLVVCPASVVLNWAEKIDEFYQGLDYHVYYGPQRDLQKAQKNGLILTTYGVVRQDLEQLRLCAFDLIILDEIQNIKNPSTGIHQAIAGLKCQVKIGLTGTPIENSLQDLRSLFDICLPGFFGSERQFERLYVQPITENNSAEARERLFRLIQPFILRRSRAQVLTELPEVIEDNRVCELSDDQISLYREVIKGREQDLEELENDMGAIPYMNILATITRLKQICCHPCLVQKGSDLGDYSSGKWDLFIELASELLAADMKFVIFSQYTGMLDLIESYLQQVGIGFGRLRGNMVAGQRQKMIDTFNKEPQCRVFCASLLAGGVGIDLTGAQAVIHYDRWWNPAKEEQATARVHRMGQKNVVQVFRLITKGTLEEKIHQLIMKKRNLADSLILEDEAGIIKQMDRKQLADLFRFSPGGFG